MSIFQKYVKELLNQIPADADFSNNIFNDIYSLIDGFGKFNNSFSTVTNFDNITESGIYYGTYSSIGSPLTTGSGGTVVLSVGEGIPSAQLGISFFSTGNILYSVAYRARTTNGWLAWETLIASKDIGAFSPLATVVTDIDNLTKQGIYNYNSVPGFQNIFFARGPNDRNAQIRMYETHPGGVTTPHVDVRVRASAGADPLWSAWKKVLLESDVGVFGATQTNVTDFNNITIPGIYYGTYSATGAPPLSNGGAQVIHMGTSTVVQFAITFFNSQSILYYPYYRFKDTNGNWSNWQRIATGRYVQNNSESYLTDAESIEIYDGFYSYIPTTLNKPPSSVEYGAILKLQGASGRGYELAISGTGPGIELLGRNRGTNGIWSAWRTVGTGGGGDGGGPIDVTAPDRMLGIAPGAAYLGSSFIRKRPNADKDLLLFEPVNTVYSNYATLISRYETLRAEFPEYITRKILGSAWGVDLYEYRFNPPTHPSVPKWHKMCLTSGMHPNEREQIIGAYFAFERLCRNWRSDPRLEFVRWNVELIFVPCINVWGMNNGHQRRNGNNVDLNRNFSWNWNDQNQPTPGAPGPSAASETETQIMQAWPSSHPDAIAFVDYHGSGNQDYVTWSSGSPASLKYARRGVVEHARYLHSNFLTDAYGTTNPGFVMSGIHGGWMVAYFSETLGKIAHTMEVSAQGLNEFLHLSTVDYREVCINQWINMMYLYPKIKEDSLLVI
jgi:hypothetical protein